MRYLSLFICLILTLSGTAQIIDNIGQVDFLDLSQTGFEYIKKEENGEYTLTNRVFRSVDGIPEWKDYPLTIDNIEFSKRNFNKLLSIDDLRETTIVEFEKLFDNRKYILYKDSISYTALAKYSKDYFVAYSYRLATNEGDEKNSSQWKIDNIDFYNYYYVKMDTRYAIILVDDEQEGCIVPLKDKLYIGVYLNNKNPEINYTSYSLKQKEKIELIKNCSAERDLFCSIQDTDEGQILYNSLGRAIPQVYDEIKIGGYYFITKKDDRYTIYNTQLDSLKLGTITFADFYCYERYIEAIANNKHIWIDYSGVTKKIHAVFEGGDIIPAGLRLVKYQIENNNGKLFFIRNRENIISASDYKTDTLTISDNLDDMTFSNKKHIKGSIFEDYLADTENSIDSYEDYDDYKNLKNEYIIIRKDGKYGLGYVHTIDEKKNTLNLNIDLKPIFEIIEKIKVSFDKDLILFYKDKLVGVYPFMKEPRYSKLLEREGCFIRFTLPSGKKGWLNTDDGKEYIDIK